MRSRLEDYLAGRGHAPEMLRGTSADDLRESARGVPGLAERQIIAEVRRGVGVRAQRLRAFGEQLVSQQTRIQRYQAA